MSAEENMTSPVESLVVEEGTEPGESMENLMEMYEESFKRFAEGEVVTGRIISVDRDFVLVDIGYKSEGQIKIHEFRDESGNITAKGGTVERIESRYPSLEEILVKIGK